LDQVLTSLLLVIILPLGFLIEGNKMHGFDHNSGEYLNVDGLQIYYEVIGNKTAPALLFLHGGLGNIEIFNNIITRLPDKFRIIGVDNRGHGKSTLNSQALSYAFLQNDVEVVLKHLNVDEVTIIGFSNGGTIAYRLAALTNLKINKIVTIGSPWRTKNIEQLKSFFSKITCEHWKIQCPSDYEDYQKLNPQPDINRIFKLVVDMALDTSDQGRPNEYVKGISCPLLITRGENDPVISNSDISELASMVKNAETFNIPCAGHEAFVEQPQAFVEKLKQFLTDN
jgi:pimeloyl-ACP methyl ester carboxylesterase